jgi:hypothetical protein
VIDVLVEIDDVAAVDCDEVRDFCQDARSVGAVKQEFCRYAHYGKL